LAPDVAQRALAGEAGLFGVAGLPGVAGLSGVAGLFGVRALAGVAGLGGVAAVGAVVALADVVGLAGVVGLAAVRAEAALLAEIGLAGETVLVLVCGPVVWPGRAVLVIGAMVTPAPTGPCGWAFANVTPMGVRARAAVPPAMIHVLLFMTITSPGGDEMRRRRR